jgi:hypothetical protein
MATQIDFKPEAKKRIARSMGYNGDMSKFPAFLASDPAKQHLMERYKKYAGGMVLKAAEGTFANKRQASIQSNIGDTVVVDGKSYVKTKGDPSLSGDEYQGVSYLKPVETETTPEVEQQTVTPSTNTASTPIGDAMANMAATGAVPEAAIVKTEKIPFDAATQNIAAGTGQVDTTAPAATQQVATSAPDVSTPEQTDAAKIKEVERVKEGTEAALEKLPTEQLDPDDPRLQIDAQQQAESSVSGLDAAQGEATLIDPDTAPKRVVGDDELVSGSQVDMDRVGETFGTGEVKAASIVDELGSLMADFEGGNTPVWAKGAMRAAREDMARRGLGGSSMSSQAIIQAAMAAALPIAQIETGNKQAMALEKAKYRAEFMKIDFDQKFQTKVINAAKVENAANMQFSADQQITLENSRAVNTMNLQNLSNRQSLVLAEASALANLDMANLNNRQQAEVMNAQNFLQVDMANMSNRQQVEMFKAQQRIVALFSDQAAGNAAKQFNASSENQMEQFFKQLQTQVQQFNSSQTNAMSQFNAGQGNAISQFNTQIQNQRDQFNAQNQLVIAQSNAQWRRQIATADTAAVNRSNEINAQNALNVSQQAYANLWQERADNMKRAWQSGENSQDRLMRMALQELENEGDLDEAAMAARTERRKGIGAWLRHIFPFT